MQETQLRSSHLAPPRLCKEKKKPQWQIFQPEREHYQLNLSSSQEMKSLSLTRADESFSEESEGERRRAKEGLRRGRAEDRHEIKSPHSQDF